MPAAREPDGPGAPGDAQWRDAKLIAGIDDRLLLRAAQAGDAYAFELLVRRHQAAVYRVAFRMLHSEADAQDATQEAFVRAWRSLGRFRGDCAVGTWLYRIVTRRCLDAIATRPRSDALQNGSGGGTDPADAVEERDRLRAVVGAIARLPGDQQAVLVLREFEGLSYDDMARVLDTTVPAVKGRVHRARLAVLEQTAAWR
jgi:RNA polymerase sigma-70 factor (ECF subfamily)